MSSALTDVPCSPACAPKHLCKLQRRQVKQNTCVIVSSRTPALLNQHRTHFTDCQSVLTPTLVQAATITNNLSHLNHHHHYQQQLKHEQQPIDHKPPPPHAPNVTVITRWARHVLSTWRHWGRYSHSENLLHVDA